MQGDELTHLSPNQVVAHNLRRARQELGWTQEDAAEQLERVTGERWSKSTFSSAENPRSKRTRHFDADLLYALALTFHRTVPDFLVPPPGVTVTGARGVAQSVPAQRKTLGGGQLQAVGRLLDPRALREVADLLEQEDS